MGDSMQKVYQDFIRYLLESYPDFSIYTILPSLQVRGVIDRNERAQIGYAKDKGPIESSLVLFLQIMPMKDDRFHDELVSVFKGFNMTSIEQFLAQRLATYRQGQSGRPMAPAGAAAAATNSASYQSGNQNGPIPKRAKTKTLVSKEKRSDVYKQLRRQLGQTYDIQGILGELYDVDVISFREKDAIKMEAGNIDKLIKLFDQFMPPKDESCHWALITYFIAKKESEFAEFLKGNLFE